MKKTFAEWMKAVDAILSRKIGVTSADMIDLCYSDMYEDGMTPSSAARRAIRNENGQDE